MNMDDRITQTIVRLEEFMPSVQDALPLPREAAEFVHSILWATNAHRALEIGTSYGYSGLWIASALAANHGTLVTVDQDPRKSSAARAAFDAAGLSEIIELRTGSALEVLPTLSGAFDFVLNDADKTNCIRYVELLEGKLADRAVILTDNTLTHPRELADFLEWIRGRPGFQSCHVPIGNGMEMTVRLPYR
jgi:predicted O-methyltransferase YrrM